MFWKYEVFNVYILKECDEVVNFTTEFDLTVTVLLFWKLEILKPYLIFAYKINTASKFPNLQVD